MTGVSHGALIKRIRTYFSTVTPLSETDPKGILMSKLNFFARFNWSRSLLASAMCCFAALIAFSSVGCSTWRSFDESAALTFRDYVWSKRAYNLRYGNCNRPYGDHFRNGFRAGYSDIASGGDGFVPALPPDDYRGYEYQSADGSKCVNAWFEGYPAGVAAARQDSTGSYNDIMISRMIDAAVKQDKTTAKLPGDVPVTDGNGNSARRSVLVQTPAQPLSLSPESSMPANPLPVIVRPVDRGASPNSMRTIPPILPANYQLPKSMPLTNGQ